MSTTNNTAYNVRTDVVTSESGLTIEEGALYTYDGELKAHLGGSTVVVKPKTTIVNISSAQILAMGTTPIELLPAAGAYKYYDVEKIILEYTNNTTAYSLVDDFLRVTYSTLGYSIDKQVITAGVDALCIADSTYGISVGNQLFSQALLPNASIELTTDNSANPTLGDGTLRVIITYTTRTFGA